ncbi:MAG: Immunoglobulin I-set domain protein [Pedosphaera sp.]|nr:Immunoglobulin I-set domain protein [Pedosphaera sp.]
MYNRQPTRKAFSSHGILQTAFVLALLLCANVVRAGLVNQWTGDSYSSGGWVDTVASVTATANGSPQQVAGAFNSHAGVIMNGGYFLIPAGAATAGSSNFTVVIVYKPNALGPFSPNYYNSIPMAAFDIGGSGQIDWGLSWGGNGGRSVVTGVGVQNAAGAANGDILQATPDVNLNAAHVVALQVNAVNTNVVLFSDGVMVATNSTIKILPRSAATTIFVGGGTFVTARFPGQIAAIQIYNDATTNCVLLSQSLLATYGTPAPITLPYATGNSVGQSAIATVGIPSSASQGNSFNVTFTSDNPSVVATTNVTFAQGQISQVINFPILGLGAANVTASGTGVGSATVSVVGLDQSGLVNQWLADNYTNNSAVWVDSIGGVAAAGTGAEVAVPAAFGPTHQGVARNGTGSTTGASGFLIPAGTAPCNLSTYTVVVAFKPTAVGPNNGNYYGSQIMFGYDIGGGGQHDFGMSWGGGTPSAGQRIVVGIGRNGGDSQIQSAGGIPLTLNATHAAALQVNAAAGTQTLFVDGLQVGQNGGLTMLAVANQAIPLLNQSSANIGNAFAGLVAEVRVYTNAAVNGAALTGLLQNKYAGFPLLTLASQVPFVDVGSNVTVNVTIPPSASLSGSYVVTLTSDTPGVVGSTNLTFAQGTTSASLGIRVVGVGGATITASGSGTTPATLLIGGLAPRALVEALRASNLPTQSPGINDGDPVNNWYGDTNVSTLFAYAGIGNSPTYHANATPNGKAATSFNLGPLILNTNNSISPLTGFTNFSIAMVYKAAAPGLGAPGVPWYNGVGVMDADETGAHNDWGTALDASGNFIFGVGNADVSMYQTNYNLVSPLFHAVVATWDGLNQQMRLYVDDKPVSAVNGPLPTGPRDNCNIALGGTASPPAARTDPAQLYIVGEIAEVQFYSGALNTQESTNLINSLQTTYGLLWPDQALCNIAVSRAIEDVGSNIVCTVTIPQGVNAGHSVTVNVTSSNPGAVTIAGGSSTNLIFATGGTNVLSFNVLAAGLGFSTLATLSSGLVGSSIGVTVQAPPVLVEAFRASSLTNQFPGITTGDGITSWTGDFNPAAVANQNNPNPPIFRAVATPSGSPSAVFSSANQNSLLLSGANSPVAGLTNFSVAMVFKATATPSSANGNWYSQNGVLDAEESANHNDWGIAMDSSGRLNFGIGNPDYTLIGPAYNLVNSNVLHVAVLAFDLIHQRMSITIDDQPTTTTVGGLTLSSGPRDPSYVQNSGGDIHIGQGSTDGLYWDGELVEADFYNGALKDPALTIASLKAAYGVQYQDEVLMSLTPLVSAVQVGVDDTLTVTIPPAANQSHAVTVFITNSNPAVVSLTGAAGNLLQVVFPTGATNVQTVTAHGVAVGTASLGYSAAGLFPGAAPFIKVIENPGNILIGQWNFNDQAHPYVDSSGFRTAGTHDGVAVGSVTLTNDVPAGLTGYSLNLISTGALEVLNTRNTEGGYLDTFDDVLSGAMTITAWVKFNGAANPTIWVPFVSKRGEDNFGYQLRRYSTGPFATFTLRNTDGADDPSGLTAYEDGNWHHVAGVWDGRTGIRSLYVDGFVDANASLTNDLGIPSTASTNSLVIGARDRSNDGSGAPLEGYLLGLLKDVRIYNFALTRPQILTVMTGQAVGSGVKLTIQSGNGAVVLSWPQGKLLQAPTPSGPWTTNTLAVSPYTVGTTNAQQYFRVQVSP